MRVRGSQSERVPVKGLQNEGGGVPLTGVTN
jgi:hypothetical protein